MVSIWLSFIAGFLSFFSPCVFPLFVVYISLITGLSVSELSEAPKNRMDILVKIFYFVLGFSIVFVILGVFAKYLFSILFFNKQLLNLISGIIVIIFGIFLMGFVNIKFLEKSLKFNLKSDTSKNTSSFILGIIFATGWTPCVGPILGSILTLASNEETFIKSAVLLLFYSFGLAIPFFVFGFFSNFFILKLKYINKHLSFIQKIVGILLIIIGVLLIYGKIF